MIVFCEDCGEKNELPATALSGGRAVFRCGACSYPNAYALKTREKTPSAADRFLDMICGFPGIVGAFLYDRQGTVIGSQMPPVLTREDIGTLGAGLVKTCCHGTSHCQDIEGMMVVISDKHFFVHRLTKRVYSVTVTISPSLPEGLADRLSGFGRGEA